MLPTQSLMLILLTLSSSYYTKLDELTLQELSQAEKKLNRQLAKERIIIENIHRSLNIFRILSFPISQSKKALRIKI